jgi:ATP-binding cassette subfamily B protein
LAVLFPVYILISDKSSRVWIQRQNEINQVEDTAFGRVLEAITSIRVVKSFLKQQAEYDTFAAKRHQIEGLTKTQSKDYYKFDFARRLLLNVILFTIYAYIVYNTYTTRFSISELILLIQLVNQARFPLFAMSFIISQIQQAQAGSKDFFEIIDLQPKIEDKPEATNLEVSKGQVEFRGVSFAYGQDKKVLSGIDFTINPGKKLAIIGESGEGKSTIANLLLRYYEPTNGQIKIDGQNILDITQKSLHQHIAVVLQDATLFSGTIRENIAYGKPEATDEEVRQAAQAANADHFIAKLPNGYNTEIGEKGIKLSGGQKQRISIARAIIKDAPILILDEATSSLDSKAEQEVQKALDTLMANRTTVIIAHRLATIKNADHIIVLKNGNILEEGQPTDLYTQGGVYTELVDLQSLTAEQRKDNQTLKDFNLEGR